MNNTVTKSKNVTESQECGDAVTASPRPWRIAKYPQCPGIADVFDASGSPSGLVAGELKPADAALIVDAVNLKTRIDEAMADEAGYLHPVVLDGKPMVFVTPPPSEAEESRMHREYETSLLEDLERFRRYFHEAEEQNDRLRDIARRMADAMQGIMDAAEGRGEGVLDAALLREARAALGEDKP